MVYNFKNKSLLIVDDCIISRTSLQQALVPYVEFIYVAEDGCIGLDMIKEHHPDIVLSDITMPCANGYELVKLAKEQHISSIFIFISAHNDNDFILDAIDVKIDAYIVKPIKIAALIQKIQVLLDEKDQNNNSKEFLHQTLSDREFEVFLDLAKGIMPRVIASKFNIKPKTVSTYRQRIMEKMKMNNNSDIIRYAMKNNLL